MTYHPLELDRALRSAVQRFWFTRASQSSSQGSSTGTRDTGFRRAVTGGAQMDGFADLLVSTLLNAGVSKDHIYQKKKMELPGWFRAEKKWDILVVADGNLLAGIELKSQVGPSFGNNFNNRTEEAIGSATDLWAAYREGAFAPSRRPWLGYLMLLEESTKSTKPVDVRQPHFRVFAEFDEASYANRYELLLTKLVRERLYDAACLLMARNSAAESGDYREPSTELSFRNLAASLAAHTRTA